MTRRIVLLVSVAAAILVAGALGVAGADTPPASAPGGITVNGSATTTLKGSPSDADIAAAYKSQLGPAIDDARGKADVIAAKVGAAVGAVTAVVEQSGGYIGCGYAYPVAMGDGGVAVGAPTPAPKPVTGGKKPRPKPKHKPKKPKAKSATSTQVAPAPGGTADSPPEPGPSECPVTASVTVTYAIG